MSPRPSALGAALTLTALLGCSHLLASCHRSRPSPRPDPARGVPALVLEVIDGDTISVRRDGHDLTVRLIGIDTPETKRPNTPVECFGSEAHDRLAALLPPGSSIRLETDQDTRDRYGRDLAYVHRSDGLFVNEAMVHEGFAGVLVFPPNTRYEQTFADALDDARLTRRGLWSACGAPHRPA